MDPSEPAFAGGARHWATVPAGWNAAGLPLSVQLVGRPGAEGTLLSLAAQLAVERPWADRHPPIS